MDTESTDELHWVDSEFRPLTFWGAGSELRVKVEGVIGTSHGRPEWRLYLFTEEFLEGINDLYSQSTDEI